MMRDERDRRGKVIKILLFVIILLVAIMLYAFLAKPVFDDKVLEARNLGQTEGYIAGINDILSQIQQMGYAEIPLSENESVYLAVVQPQA